MNVLLVDDEVVVINILKETIDWKALGVDHIFSACNAMEAKEILKKEAINIIICDIEMPQENGLELLKWTHGCYPKILNIILTAFPDFHYAQSAISIGVYQFLLKPVDFHDIEYTVRRAIEKIKQDEQEDKYREIGKYLSSETPMGELLNRESVSKTPDDKSIIRSVKEYIEKHYNEEINRQDMERLTHLNQDYLNRLFKESTGHSLMEYTQVYRISVAKYMLLHTNLSISNIALQTGHNSPSYFSEVFKKWEKISPAEFRHLHHNANS